MKSIILFLAISAFGKAIIKFLVVVLLGLLVWYCVGLFIKGIIHTVIGIIIGVIVLFTALELFDLL